MSQTAAALHIVWGQILESESRAEEEYFVWCSQKNNHGLGQDVVSGVPIAAVGWAPRSGRTTSVSRGTTVALPFTQNTEYAQRHSGGISFRGWGAHASEYWRHTRRRWWAWARNFHS